MNGLAPSGVDVLYTYTYGLGAPNKYKHDNTLFNYKITFNIFNLLYFYTHLIYLIINYKNFTK